MISDIKKSMFSNLDIRSLIELGMGLQDKSTEVYDELKYVKFLLTKHMRESRASILAHPTIECKGKKELTSWDYGKLASARELLDPKDVDLFYTPEHEEVMVVQERYDMRVGNGFKKYGGEVKTIIENATIEGEIKDVQLKRKE